MSLDIRELADIKRSYARRLRAAREAHIMPDGKRMSQFDLAVAIGTTPRSVQVWENPEVLSLPDGKNAVKVEVLLNVPLYKGRYLASLLEPVAS